MNPPVLITPSAVPGFRIMLCVVLTAQKPLFRNEEYKVHVNTPKPIFYDVCIGRPLVFLGPTFIINYA